MSISFKAFRIHERNGSIHADFETMVLNELTAGDVVIEVHYSAINYKDALATTGRGKILRRFPLNGGVDLSGVVHSSTVNTFKTGDKVLVTGCGLSETYDGGYAEYARVPEACVIPLPTSLNLQEAMVMGTPALTAALALYRMQENNQSPEQGPILVTGASGGVGQVAIDIFSTQGYEVIAQTSKLELRDYLLSLGAKDVMSYVDAHEYNRPLEKAVWAGAVDTVGGETLAYLTRTVKEWGNIAAIGLAAGSELKTTVMPFILRGVSLLGISSTNCSCDLRRKLWQLLGEEWRPSHLDKATNNLISLDELDQHFQPLLDNQIHGRTVVQIQTKKSKKD